MRYITLFLIMFILWMLFTFNGKLPNIVIGITVSLITTLIFGRSFVKDTKKFFQPKRYFWIIVYLIIFVWECIKANIDVAYRVLSPKMPIKPAIVKAKTTLKTDIAKTFLANSITMTPGTITVDIIDDEFFIHWIYLSKEKPEEYTHIILGRFEKFLKRIFE